MFAKIYLLINFLTSDELAIERDICMNLKCLFIMAFLEEEVSF